jgi:hypothetical protein
MRITPALFVAWVGTVDALTGFWFTFRLARKLSGVGTEGSTRRRLLEDPFLRSDLYLAGLAWTGLIMLFVLYFIGAFSAFS